jgi:predicted PurR-regulated permease PerM
MPSAAHAWPQHRHVSLLTRTVVAIAIIAFLYWAQAVLIPVALAIFFTFVLAPVVVALQRRGLSRVPAAILVTLLTGAVIVGFGLLVAAQFVGLIGALDRYQPNIQRKIEGLRQETDQIGWERLDKLIHELSGAKAAAEAPAPDGVKGTRPVPVIVEQTEPAWMRWLPGYFDSFTRFLSQAALVLVLTVFMLLAREDLRNRLIRLIGRGRISLTTRAVDDASQRISRFLLTQLVLNLSFGVVVAIGLSLLGVEAAILWGALAAALRYVPYIGGPVACLFPAVMSVAQFEGWWEPAVVVAFIIGLEVITSNIFEPLLFGHNTGVSAVALLASAAVWAFLWGPVGLVLSCPLTVCLVVLGKYVPGMRFFAILLGDEPALDPDIVYYQRLAARDPEEASRLLETTAGARGVDAVYDALMVPALKHTGYDLHRGGMDKDEAALVYEATGRLLEKTEQLRAAVPREERPGPQADARPLLRNQVRILGVPVRDRADELGLAMLGQMLDPAKWDLQIAGSDLLSSELLQKIEVEKPSIICLAALPPGGLTWARYLCKRLRRRFPALKIMVGRWGLRRTLDRDRDALRAAGADVVEATLLGTRAQLTAWLMPLAQQKDPTRAEQRHAACDGKTSDEYPPWEQKEVPMADLKDKTKQTIDTAANKAQEGADKAIDKGKEMASKAGDKVKETGQKLKNAGK